MAEKYQFFDGKKFTRDDKTGYYLCSTGDENNVRKRMHVYVWEYFNGPISKGYHIHHIDGDKSNNDIQNLQMLSATEHERLHGKMLTENQRETLRKNMAKATVMAKEWHNSNEGHEWHKKHYEQMKEKLHIPKRFVCESRAMCASALTASADELDIHSPSRKFKNIIGKNIPKGIAKGVRESKSELVGEMESVVNEALSAAQNASKSGKYSEIGSNLLSGLSTSLSTSKSRSSETIQEIIDQQQESLSNANQKKEEALQNKIDKLGSKKANKKRKAALKKRLKQMKAADKKQESQLKTAGEKAAAAYNDAFEKESTRITKIAEKSIQELSETYQTKYNDIKSKMDTLTEKQRSWGNVYDLKQNIADIKRYQTNLKALENKIPESMMDKILGMNMDEATAYMDWFQGMTSAEQKAYLNDWNTMYSSSETFSKNFFSDDFGKIQKEYQDKLKKATDDLQAEMNQIGTNIAKGLTAGMDSESRNLSKTMKKICANLVKTAKKQLKIKSPSRVFKRIGVYNIQGAEKGHEAEAPRLYRQVENVSETLAERFAKANLKVSLPDIAGRTQAALSRQVSKVSASIQPQLTAALAGDAGQTIYNGPEKIELVTNLDGREIARTSVPYIDAYLGNMAARKARGGV